MSDLTLRTPEGITFSYPLGGPIQRMLAMLVDQLVINAAVTFLSWLSLFLQLLSSDIALGFLLITYFFVSTLYGILMEAFCNGQTLGKKLLRLRVIDIEGLRLSFPQVFIRNLFRAVDQLPIFFLLGGSFCALTRYHQRLGDLAANTVVIRLQRHQQPDISALEKPLFNSLRQHPHLTARLRQRISPKEAGLLLSALIRRDEIDAAQRLDLFRELADYCRTLISFPEETFDNITDEQIIRNVVDVVFEKAR